MAGAVVLSNTITHPTEQCGRYVLVISSSRHANKLVLPKGGWEEHETVEEAALRESWEEAGITGTITSFLCKMEDKRPAKNWAHQAKYKGLEYPDGFVPPRAEYQYFEVDVTEVADSWPEKEKRNRHWMRYREAKEALKGQESMAEALEKSRIIKE